MFENEVQDNSGVQEAVSSEPQIEPVNEPNTTPAPEANQPFHEHPRFKELVEQKNQFATQVKEYERKMQEMQSQLQQLSAPKSQPEQDALLARLKGIDPEFGGRFEQMVQKLAKLDQVEQELAASKAETVQSRALSTIERLHTEHNVPKELQDLYRDQIEIAAMRNPKMGLNDLPEVYKSVHNKMSQFLDGVKRSERAGYVTDKKKDAAIPSTQTKGQTAKPSDKVEWSNDEAVRQQQMVDMYRKIVAAQRDNS